MSEDKAEISGLRRQVKELSSFFQLAEEMLCIAGLDGRFKRVNPAWSRVLGHDESWLLATPFLDLVHPDDRQRTTEIMASLAQGESVRDFVNRFRTRDGRYVWLAWTTKPAVEEGLLYAVAHDVTELLAAQDDLAQQRATMEGILRAAPVGVGLIRERIITWVSENLCRMLGYLREELLGQSTRLLYLSQEEFDRVGRDKLQGIAHEGLGGLDTQWLRKDGRPIDVFLRTALLHPEDLEAGVAFTALDITERKQAEQALRESETRYRQIFETNQAVKLIVDPQTGGILDANQAACAYYGYSLKGLTSLSVYDLNQLPRQEVEERMARVRRGEAVSLISRHRLASGEIRDVEIFSGPVTLDGRPLLHSIVFDISERKRAEEQAKMLARFPGENPSPILRVDGQGVLLYANHAAAGLLAHWGCAEGRPLPEPWRETVRQAMAGQRGVEQETRINGQVFALRLVPIPGEDYLNIYGSDITRSKEAQEEVGRQRDLAQTYLDVAAVIFVALDPEGRVTMANRQCCKVLGYAEAEILGKDWFANFVPARIRKETREAFFSLVAGEADLREHHENSVLTRDGQERLIAWRNAFFLDDQGNLRGTLSSGDDVTDRRRAQQDLAESQARYRQLFGAMLNGIALHEIITDQAGRPVDYRFLEVNPAFERLTGLKRADIVGRTVLEVMPGTEAHWIDTYGKVALTRTPVYFENFSQDLDKHFEVAAYSPKLGQFAVVFSDVTPRKKAEEERERLQAQIQHAQKLESLGVLAGGIAHDFNNLLVSILGNADLALLDLPPGSPSRRRIEDLRDTAIRASELSNQMLAYSGKGRFVVEPLSLNKVVDEMGHLLRVSIPKNVVVKFDFHPNLPAVEVDATQIRQVVMNLITNASEAVGKRSGVVTISTGITEVDQNYLAGTYVDDDLVPGYYAYLEVSDTGQGMDAETRARIFDPFFTTKFTGRGLGLSAVLGIVRGHRGAIKVYSEAGRGSSVKVLLPCLSEPAKAEGKPAEEPRSAAMEMGGLVLVVDDEESVRSVTKMMLERKGFTVLTAEDGRVGVDVFREHAGEVRAVILDMTMPHLNGEQAFGEMRRINPEVPVVLASGYNEQDATSRFAGKGLAGFIQKPFRMKDLLEKLRQALERGGAGGGLPPGA
jgi:PAS domain S-box-containing protein